MAFETLNAGRNVLTQHGPEHYPGLQVVRPSAQWLVHVILSEEGQTIEARGGERVYAYDTVDAGHAEGFVLEAGDRATLVRSGLAHFMVEWRIERAAR
jgi:hypothetical protein